MTEKRQHNLCTHALRECREAYRRFLSNNQNFLDHKFTAGMSNVGLLESAAGRIGAVNWHALRLYRLSHWLWLRGHRASALLVTAINRVLTGVDIGPGAEFGPGLVIVHGHGIVVDGRVRAGRNCALFQGVTLGMRSVDGASPTLGNRVTVWPGAKVLGAITLGDDVQIAANAVVIHDVPAGATVKAPLGRIG